MAEYLHPSVSSRIIDQSTIFVTSAGATTLFQAITSDHGPDNTVLEVTSPSEAEFLFGKPNLRKHGQAHYNVDRWLTAGGEALVIRVMPEDARMAHVMINVQTKKVGPVTHVRPTILTNPNRANTLSAVEMSMTNNYPKTVDGFDNNVLCAFYPRQKTKPARGEKYDEYGILLTLRSDLDETYSFRTYDAYVARLGTTGMEIVEGPFLVSFAPESISLNNESLHIPQVIDTYSQFVGCLFNTAAYDALGEAINPAVDPKYLDFLSLQDRNHSTNPAEHNAAIMADYTDLILPTIVNADGSKRLADYAAALTSVQTTEDAMDELEASTYDIKAYELKDALLNGDPLDPTEPYLGTVLGLEPGSIELMFQELLAAVSDADINEKSDAIIAAGTAIKDDLQTAIDFAQALQVGTEVIEATSKLSGMLIDIAVINVTRMKVASEIGKVNVSRGNLQVVNLETDLAAKLVAAEASAKVAEAAVALGMSIGPDPDVVTNDPTTGAVDLVAAALAAVELAKIATVSTYNAKVAAAVAATLVALDASEASLERNLIEAEQAAAEDVYADLKECILKTGEALDASINLDKSSPALVTALTMFAVSQRDAARGRIQAALENTFNVDLHNFQEIARFQGGLDGSLAEGHADRTRVTTELLVEAYTAQLDPELSNKKLYEIDVCLDANYPIPVKTAIVTLCETIRKDCIAMLDMGFTANPDQSITKRRNEMTYSTPYAALFTQDFLVYDTALGVDVKMTLPYFLAEKIPQNDVDNGIQWTFVGPRRGTLDGFKAMSWNPTEPWKERLYQAQLNYTEKSIRRTNIGSQLTSQTRTSALSDINNVRVLLRMIREVEAISETYSFEFGDSETYSAMQNEINQYLAGWVSNRACTSVSATVYASDYDKKRKQARVRVEIIFNNVIERILQEFAIK
jgi:hypothetical protein